MTCFQPCEASRRPADQIVETPTLFHLKIFTGEINTGKVKNKIINNYMQVILVLSCSKPDGYTHLLQAFVVTLPFEGKFPHWPRNQNGNISQAVNKMETPMLRTTSNVVML